MITRILVALVGAVIVTAGLLFAMDRVTSLFRNHDFQRYFRINDILPKPDPGRPTRPRSLSEQPDVPESGNFVPEIGVTVETPDIETPTLQTPPPLSNPGTELPPETVPEN
jgi:hypothetical protein